MEVFWPEAKPESARNNLNVALHNLRQAFRKVTQTPVIEYDKGKGSYRVNPELQVWIDVDEFNHHLQAARKLESVGQLSHALGEYEIAASLYQGDFLSDDLYEEWPILTRERLRIAYLDLLDHLSHIYFSQGQYTACVTLCQLILERDNCREDAHRRLMRCYSRQGQQHLALRQFQNCVETLRSELDVDPEQATKQLCERIRRHESI
jgi:DNA-binding SARP family transcriptional activator